MTAPAPPAENRTLAAGAAVLGFATIIGFTDNFVRVIAAEAGLWQFHAVRTVMVAAILAGVSGPLGLRLRPVNPRAVAARSALHASAMVVYFGCLAFLPVAEVAAGLFTAPIFVLLLSRFVYGHALGPVRILAVGVGFLGVILVLTPGAGAGVSWAAILPVAAAVLYALGNLATREWCAGETAETLTAGFFLGLGLYGLAGLGVLTVLAPEAPAGAEGFILRGWVWPPASFWAWTLMQAVGSLVGVGLVVRAYQLAEASRVSIFEYVILPVSALWSWVI
ncbi:MAG: DMT family transporter, partial [Paracoccaceae bacterium]|nr:DMT family transporter [Paracoccaceae bacterium]